MRIDNSLILLIFFLTLTSCGRYNNIEKYDDGSIKYKCEMTPDFIKDGTCIGFYRNGKKQYVETYSRGVLNGVSIHYHENGNLSWKAVYAHGKKNGIVKYYDSLGHLYQENSFSDNLLNGMAKTFFSNGNLKSIGRYQNGVPVDTLKSYYPDQSLHTIQVFDKEGYVVAFYEYSEAGKLIDTNMSFSIAHTLVDQNNIKLDVQVNNPMYDFMVVIVGKIDWENMIILDTIGFDYSYEYKITLDLMTDEIDDPIQGIIYDLQVLNNKSVIKRSSTFSYKVNALMQL